MSLLHGELTEQIIGAFYKVYNTLGYGFLEKVYENATRVELTKRGVGVVQQMPIQVLYEAESVGEYFADLCVEGKVIVELKVAEALSDDHEAQLFNYLKATHTEVGFLMNFGPKPEFRRKIWTKT